MKFRIKIRKKHFSSNVFRRIRDKTGNSLLFFNQINQNFEKAYKIYSKLAFENDSVGLNGLAYMLYKGLGRNKNIKEAIKYFKKSAELGSPDG